MTDKKGEPFLPTSSDLPRWGIFEKQRPRIFVVNPVPMTTHTCKLSPTQATALQRCLKEMDFKNNPPPPYARFAAEKDRVNLVFYESGKLVVQGKGTQEFVEFVLEPSVLQEARIGYEEVLNPELMLPRIGVDESGKGDFFGPMCIAGVYINADVVKLWKGAGIRDSKAVGSDKKIGDLAKVILATPGCVSTVVPIGNEAYNRLYRQLHSVNAILAWGHARVIENLMLWRHKMNPLPVRAISDQFAADKATVAKALMSLGREIELIQRHKAESDLAVAAASILARNEFVTRLDRMGKTYGVRLPKGASEQVKQAGVEFIAKHGKENLDKVGKMHFRTSFQILGLPEPPRKEWKR